MTHSTRVEVENASSSTEVPSEPDLSRWISVATAELSEPCSVYLRIVDSDEIRQLNAQYRDKPGATNVLSFPLDAPIEDGSRLLGDLVICAEVVATEAVQQHKRASDHWAHLVIHGTLHLLGYDHVEEADAERMEDLERDLLRQFGISDPYQPA